MFLYSAPGGLHDRIFTAPRVEVRAKGVISASVDMALVGQTPLSESDKLIYRGLHLISPSPINPDERFPLGPPAPENAPSESRALSMTIGTAFAVALVVIITVSRLVIRKFYLKAFRADDWVIIPGAVRVPHKGMVHYLTSSS